MGSKRSRRRISAIPMVQGECCSWGYYMPLGTTLLTLGISDAFAGGFVAGIVEEKSLDESIDMGHWLASLSIKELGPQYVQSLLTNTSHHSVKHHKDIEQQQVTSTQTRHSSPCFLQFPSLAIYDTLRS